MAPALSGSSARQNTAAAASSVCLQTLTVPDLRTVVHAPSDTIFTPYFFGSLAHIPPAWDPEDPSGDPYPERRA